MKRSTPMRSVLAGWQRGFTLIETVIVMTILGVVAGMVAIFIRTPIDNYLGAVRRTNLADEADTAQRYLARDLHAALPNSIVCTTGAGATPTTLSFLNIASGGRYREYPAATPPLPATNTALRFGESISSFNTIGNAAVTARDAYGQAIPNNLNVVVGSLGSGVNNCYARSGANAKAGTLSADGLTVNLSAAATIAPECAIQQATVQNDTVTTTINEENERSFGRFYLAASGLTTYQCSAAGTPIGLTRNGQQMASHLASCAITCDGVNSRIQTISLDFTMTDANESIRLMRQVHVENLP